MTEEAVHIPAPPDRHMAAEAEAFNTLCGKNAVAFLNLKRESFQQRLIRSYERR